MTVEEKVHAWGKDDSLIMCIRVRLDQSDASCELCNCWIAALPESRAKARQPGWHLICRECVSHVRKEHELKFNGRFRTEAEAKKVLP